MLMLGVKEDEDGGEDVPEGENGRKRCSVGSRKRFEACSDFIQCPYLSRFRNGGAWCWCERVRCRKGCGEESLVGEAEPWLWLWTEGVHRPLNLTA